MFPHDGGISADSILIGLVIKCLYSRQGFDESFWKWLTFLSLMYFCFSSLLSVHVQMMSGHRVASACQQLPSFIWHNGSVRGRDIDFCPPIRGFILKMENAAEEIIWYLSDKNPQNSHCRPFFLGKYIYFFKKRKSKGGICSINDGCITFRWVSFRALVLCMLNERVTVILNGLKPLSVLFFTLVFLHHWQVKMSAVENGLKIKQSPCRDVGWCCEPATQVQKKNTPAGHQNLLAGLFQQQGCTASECCWHLMHKFKFYVLLFKVHSSYTINTLISTK